MVCLSVSVLVSEKRRFPTGDSSTSDNQLAEYKLTFALIDMLGSPPNTYDMTVSTVILEATSEKPI